MFAREPYYYQRPHGAGVPFTPPAGSPDYQSLVEALSPVCYFPMQEASGTLADTSGNSETGTATGSPTYQVTGPTINTEATYGITIGNGIYFTLSALTVPSSSGFTVSAWVKAPADAANRYILRWLTTGQGWFYVRKQSADRLQVVTVQSDGSVHGNVGVTVSSWPDDTWVWVGARYDVSGNILRAYQDTLTADTSSFTGSMALGSPTCYIGSSGTEYWDGEVSHVAYWDTPLSDADMTSLRTGS